MHTGYTIYSTCPPASPHLQQLLRRVLVCWHGRNDMSVLPHHLWPPVEPWRGCCLRRSGPGRYSNRHLPAALMRWWGLRWATLRSDCWVAGAGWERANSAGRGTNSQLARTRSNLEKRQNAHTPTTTHTFTHTHTQDQAITAIVWTISSIAWLTNLTNGTTCIQLPDFGFILWAKPEAPLCYEGHSYFCWHCDYFAFSFNSTVV